MNDQLPDCIVKLIGDITGTKRVTNKSLIEAVGRAGLSEEALLHLALFDHPAGESYGRRLLFQDDRFQMLLMSWNPGDFTSIHNHGETEWGAVCFLGDTAHRLYEVKDNKVLLSHKDVFENGRIMPMHGSLTHMMGNEGNAGFMTLHIYGADPVIKSRTNKEKVFLPEHKLVTLTNGPAYLNFSENNDSDSLFFNGYTGETLLDYFNLVKPFYLRNDRVDILEKIARFEKDINTYYLQ